MELVKALQPLECVEESLALLYQSAADRFAADEQAARLFAHLAFDEASHTQDLQFLRRLVRHDPDELLVLDAELPAIQADLIAIQCFLERLPEVTVEESLRFAARIEASAAETHARVARAMVNQEAAESFDGLSAADRRHLQSVEILMKERGVPHDTL
jgi:rubrerythrin